MKLKGFFTTLFGIVVTLLLSSFILSACRDAHSTYPTVGRQSADILQQSIENNEALMGKRHFSRRQIPDRVNAALLPPLSHYVNPSKKQIPRFDVAAKEVPAKDFFMGLVADSDLNMIVSPEITGTITMTLKSVTLRETLDAARDLYGFDYRQTSYGYEIMPPHIQTQMFHVNYLDVTRNGRSYMQLTTGQVSNIVGTVSAGNTLNSNNTNLPPTNNTNTGQGTISSVETKSEMRFWRDLENSLSQMIGTEGGRNLSVNAQAGIIVVKAFPVELHRVERYLRNLQKSLNRQVILEAKILEVELDKRFDAGIDWAVLSNPAVLGNTQAGIGQLSSQLFEDAKIPPFNGIFALRINGDFKVLINLLQTQGNVQILSSPHIATVNNQKAVIKVGSDEFFVTGVSTTQNIVGTTSVPSQDVSLTPFFSGITLDVTPEISGEDTVVLHIHPSVSQVTQQTKIIGLGTNPNGSNNNLTLPLARSTIRESDNIVHAKNGQVIVIGGLMQNFMKENLAATPGLSNFPFLGTLFRRTQQQATKSELVILLRPVVVTEKTTVDRIKEDKRIYTMNKRPFHQGGFPLVFGNEAERTCNN